MIKISKQQLQPTFKTKVIDEQNQQRDVNVAGENPLIIKVDGQEIVTLMTIGTHPEALVLGYLRNQRFISSIDDLNSIEVDWANETATVITKNGIARLKQKTQNRIITTGCGQGTVFSCSMDAIYQAKLAKNPISSKIIYQLLANLNQHNRIYQSAGAVHTCALCRQEQVLIAVEDVGRHNAADIISGLMWLNNIKNSNDLLFYTTGRVTSEIVMKVAQINVSVLLSRSGVTQMGLELAQDIGMMIIARAKGKHFLVFTEAKRFK